MLAKVIRLYHTIKYLKPKQIVWRVVNLLPRFISASTSYPDVKEINFKFISKIKLTSDYDNFSFLNETHQLSVLGWDNSSVTKLWRYNLHYFDFLRQNDDSEDSFEKQKTVIHNWIRENAFGKGTGWEPYPTSLRIINWMKWHLKTKGLTDDAKLSLWNQVKWLASRPEYHLLGNHLFVNAKAMLFACVFFGLDNHSTIYKKALGILTRELDEQFLEDGAHFELSPMYHALAMEDLLDLYQLYSALPASYPSNQIIEKYKQGMNWFSYMKYENDELAHFNDCANGIAPSFDELDDLGKSIGIAIRLDSKSKFIHFAESGFAVFKDRNIHLIADIGQIGPDYLPGHGHADALSFELAIKGHRIIVNSGTSEYGMSSERLRQRSTAAHSTIELDNQSSSEVWSGFRVARRACVSEIRIFENNQVLEFSALHNGYSRLEGSPKHRRKWQVNNDSVEIFDEVSGNRNFVQLRLYLHPEVLVENNDNCISLSTSTGNLATITSNQNCQVVSTSYHDRFGSNKKNNCLVIGGSTPFSSRVTINWNS